jgi:hypothetical protein
MTDRALILSPDYKTVVIDGILFPCSSRVFRALESFVGKQPGERVQLTKIASGSHTWSRAIDDFLSAHPEWGFERDCTGCDGSALNFTVRRQRATRAAVHRKPAPLSRDEMRAITERYARGEITREEMSRLFWKAGDR